MALESGRMGDEIDFRQVVKFVAAKRLVIVSGALVGLVIGAIYAYLIAKPVFESSALLIQTQTPSVEQLGAAAALLGKKGGATADVELYQSLLVSRSVLQRLFRAPIRNESDTAEGRIEPLWKVCNIDTSNPKKMEGWVRALKSSIFVGTKESGEGGILEVRFSAGTPWLAQQIGNLVLEIGQEELRRVRVERSIIITERLALAVNQAKEEWEISAKAVAGFRTVNRTIIAPDKQYELSRLELEKLAKEQKYLGARREYESSLLERAKAAPPMLILDPANLPASKLRPKRILMLIVGLMVGGILTTSWVLVKNIWDSHDGSVKI